MDRLNNVMSTTLIVFIVSLNNLQEPLYIPISFKHFTLLEAMATINLSNKSCVINDVYTTTEWMNENRHCNNMSVSNNICMFLWLIFSPMPAFMAQIPKIFVKQHYQFDRFKGKEIDNLKLNLKWKIIHAQF